MIHTSTGKHTKMPVLVFAKVSKGKFQYRRRLSMPILVLAIDLYQYWHYMIHTSTGRHTKMPALVLAQVAKEIIPVWAPSGYAHTSIGNRSVPVLALYDPYQLSCACWRHVANMLPRHDNVGKFSRQGPDMPT